MDAVAVVGVALAVVQAPVHELALLGEAELACGFYPRPPMDLGFVFRVHNFGSA